MRMLLWLVLAGLFVSSPRSVEACSCMARSPCQLLAAADAVFVADVLDVAESGSGRKLVTMWVVRGHKGSPNADEVVVVAMPRGSSASCSLEAIVGARFVIFATVRDGGFSTNLCSGSHGVAPDAAPPDLPVPCPRSQASRRSIRPGVSGVTGCLQPVGENHPALAGADAAARPRARSVDHANDLADARPPRRALDNEASHVPIAEVPDVEHCSDEDRLDRIEAGDSGLGIARTVRRGPARGGAQQDTQGDGGEAGNEDHDDSLRHGERRCR